MPLHVIYSTFLHLLQKLIISNFDEVVQNFTPVLQQFTYNTAQGWNSRLFDSKLDTVLPRHPTTTNS